MVKKVVKSFIAESQSRRDFVPHRNLILNVLKV